MRKLWLLPIALALGGCLGHSSSGNELTGQVKRVQHCGDLLLPRCPLLCPDYVHVDISLGTMRYGVWSSTQDIWLWVKKNHVDQWLVAAQYFADNFEAVDDHG